MTITAFDVEFVTPSELAIELGVSERRVRADARRHGLCVIVGNKMLLTRDDVRGLLEVWRPKPTVRPRPDELGPPLPGGYEALVKFRERQKREAEAQKKARGQRR